MKNLRVLGIMSGTSLDGVDYALCDVSAAGLKLRAMWSAAFPRALRERLHAAARGEATSWETAQLHHDLGRFYAAKATSPRGTTKAQLVGLHGQTVFHNPDRRAPATLQLGESAFLAEKLRVPVVSNFRAADLAAGGQGAPLATAFHVRAFARRGAHVCVNNLGGISNVTSIEWRTSARPRVMAFDTGPANVLLDLAMRHFTRDRLAFDRDGARAARGRVSEPLLCEWLRHPFLRRPPPKSTGREMFGEKFLAHALNGMRRRRLSKFDFIATLTAFTARSLAENYRAHLPSSPDEVVLCGGGASNPVLVEMIRGALRELTACAEVSTSVEHGWPVQAVEPAAFAWLAWLRWRGLPGNLPETTGARRAVLCGQITS
ncbi:MAG: anhydro-N-acetylmuramic acid kinase [Verrucomicrobia bacterium]|nr:anhydro-N-acetylmuramic acid kinase [Verrucomicrobiota bacterium]